MKQYWPADKQDKFLALNDELARARTPFPYVIYESSEPIIKGHSSGSRAWLEQQYQDVPIQFRVHAKPANGLSGRKIAIELAKEIMGAFDPGTDRLDLAPDVHLTTVAQGDFHVREGDDEWLWVVQYLIRLDATYLMGD